MKLKRLVQWSALAVIAALSVGCSRGSDAPAETWAALDAVPDGAQCVHVIAEDGTREQALDVSGGAPALLHLDKLPATSAVSAVGFTTTCDAVPAGSDVVPDWVADAATVQAGASGAGRVAIALHENRDRGHKHHCHGDHDGDDNSDGGTAMTNEPLRIEQVDYHGSGCPAGSVAVGLSPDHLAATVTFSKYQASAGPGVDGSQLRKSCNLDFRLHVPGGRTVAVSTIDYRGFVHLDDAMEAALKTHVGFKDGCGQDRDVQRFSGPIDQDYQMHDEVKIAAQAWSPCGGRRTLDVDSTILVDNSDNPTGMALLTVDSVDQEVKQTYHLQTKACP
jgi:hypothetical protein